MARVWTHGVWTVRPGREDEFMAAWKAMAEQAMSEFDPPGRPHLLRDRERSNVFRSFGPWNSQEAVERFRASIGSRIAAMKELLETFEFFTLDEVSRGG